MKTISRANRTITDDLVNFGASSQYFLLSFLLLAYISCPYDFFSCVDGLTTPWTNIRAAKLLSKLRCVGVIGWLVFLRPAIRRNTTQDSDAE